jgi:hypothetical protein
MCAYGNLMFLYSKWHHLQIGVMFYIIHLRALILIYVIKTN